VSAVWVQILATRGSTPREAGTAMKVGAQTLEGTIGGGALEHRATQIARRMLAEDAPEKMETLPLGPSLGQCCGGSVTLRFTREALPVDAPGAMPGDAAPSAKALPLWIWGAGHVGRAVVRASPPREVAITWIDSAPDRFPADVPARIATIPAADMPRLAARAPRDAAHLILTYSHEIDLALCAALLKRGFGFCGLIGSETKWARFRKRLEAAGLDPAPITCPIGDKALGKHPDAIARGTIAALLRERTAA
jgi:xanthine dehydrogenase accessory factor